MATVTFRMSARQFTTKDGKKTFCAFSAQIGRKWYKIKFTQESEGAPRKPGVYAVSLDKDQLSIQHGKKIKTKEGDDFVENDTLWVRGKAFCEPVSEDELRKENAAKIDRLFDDAARDGLDGELPF